MQCSIINSHVLHYSISYKAPTQLMYFENAPYRHIRSSEQFNKKVYILMIEVLLAFCEIILTSKELNLWVTAYIFFMITVVF